MAMLFCLAQCSRIAATTVGFPGTRCTLHLAPCTCILALVAAAERSVWRRLWRRLWRFYATVEVRQACLVCARLWKSSS